VAAKRGYFFAVLTLAITAQVAATQDAVDWQARFQEKLAELREQGEPVTMEEVLARRPQIPDDENSALVFLKAFAAQEAVGFALQGGPAIENGFPPEVGMRHSDAALQVVRASVKADAEALRLIHEAARLPHGTYPITPTPNPFDINMANLGKLRNAARLCLREASVAAHKGDGAAAADSLRAVRRLSASIGDRTLLIEALVRMAVDSVLCDGIEKTLGLCQMPAESVKMLAHELALEEGELSLVEPMRTERAAGCQFLMIQPQSPMAGLNPLGALSAAARARSGVEYLDAMREFVEIAGRPDRERLALARELGARIENTTPKSSVAAMLLPALSRVFEGEVIARTRLKVARTALAVEQYRLKSGAWPKTLDALVPDVLDAIPQDPFVENPVRYDRDATGAVVSSQAADIAFHLLDPARRGAREWQPQDNPGLTMLHAAAQSGNKQMAERLLEEGSEVDARDAAGRTALHLAAEAGRREIAELLLQHGADVNATDLQGHTPTGLAVEAGHAGLADFLREHGGIE
jgi:hypothetical protein